MYSKELEELIDAALADGVLTEKEKQILFKKAKAQGIDLDEFEMVLNARLLKVQQPQSAHLAKEKKGNIITCPNCGTHVSALAGVCPECGHEFTNIGAISSAQLLANKINEISEAVDKNGKIIDWHKERTKNTKIAQYISNFPIPNAKADLFEFSATMKSKMQDIVSNSYSDEDKEAGAQLMTSYLVKYKECIIKIRALFPEDAYFAQILSSYNEDIKKAQKAIKHQRAGEADKSLIGILVISIIVIALHVWFYVDDDFEWWESMLWGGGTLVGGIILSIIVSFVDK